MIIDNKSNESNEIRIWILPNESKWQETSGKTWISYWIPAWPLKTGEASLQTLLGCDLILAEAIEDGFVQDLIGTSTAAPWYWQLWVATVLDPDTGIHSMFPVFILWVIVLLKMLLFLPGRNTKWYETVWFACSKPKPFWGFPQFTQKDMNKLQLLFCCESQLALSAKMKSSPCLGFLRGLVQAFQPGCLSSGSSGENPPVWGWFRPPAWICMVILVVPMAHRLTTLVTSTIPSMVHKPWTNQPDLDGTGEPLWFSNPLTVIVLIMAING